MVNALRRRQTAVVSSVGLQQCQLHFPLAHSQSINSTTQGLKRILSIKKRPFFGSAVSRLFSVPRSQISMQESVKFELGKLDSSGLGKRAAAPGEQLAHLANTRCRGRDWFSERPLTSRCRNQPEGS